ncbi:hypothetical protein K1719_017889 [Acacia pycnantha]|nr:hypothetical protein K1719_017889 [Acacia pycnantha]
MVEESPVQKLPYLFAVMKETLRLHPTVPLSVPHSPSETTILGDYTYNPKRLSCVYVREIHRDPSIWDNPLHFDPSRFLDGQYDYKGNDFNYLPWKVPQGQKLDISEKFGVALKMKMPLVVIPTPRLSNPTLYDQ